MRKDLTVERARGCCSRNIRYFFYITNDWALSAEQVIGEAQQRCDQENLIGKLKSGVRALHAPVNTLDANRAYMTMAALAWTLKAATALLLPVSPRWATQHEQRRRPAAHHGVPHLPRRSHRHPLPDRQHSRHTRWRILAWNPWLGVLFRLLDAL